MELTNEILQQYQEKGPVILVCSTPISLPFSFIVHTFLVVVTPKSITRYEVYGLSNDEYHQRGTYVVKDYFLPTDGIRMFISSVGSKPGLRFSPKVLFEIHLDDVSRIENIATLVDQYPFAQRYSYVGPNSNTFASWVIEQLGVPLTFLGIWSII